jgi:D-alanyl-D-alanine carboxypeptidase (penicillin-binding protein 5/6)
VAVENITDWDQTFTMHIGITDYCFVNDCSVVGYELDEVIPVRELLYGCILSSGADACLALAEIVAGSHEGFVELMNAKLEDLGLSDTSHFTNCVGLYDENHYCTVEDMALMLKAALDNELCREVMSTKVYTTAPTTQHTEGQDLSNWCLRRIEDKDTGSIEVRYAKTGYVAQAGSCAASCGENAAGKRFLCVTANAYSSWRAIYDHVDLYNAYCQS